MRIRLCVRRNGLPDANLLWPAVEQVNGSKQKIADLITAINETMPLESLNWTLEDYVVEIAGFECLHWQFLGDVLKDEDQVIIRPMEQVEVRARQLSGRHQISSAGFHLVDGVPFGTRPLRPLSRPSVVIPPRKRRRISTDETDVSPLGSIEPGAQLSIANVDNDEQQLVLLNSGNATLREESADASDERPNKRAKTNKTVHFGDLDEDEDDDEDDGDFNDDEDASSSDSSSDSDESSSDSDSSEGEAPSEESLHQEQEQEQEQDTWEGFDDAPARPRDSAPPYMGRNITKARNQRRRNAKRLAHLVKTGVLPQGSTVEDLRKFLVENERSYRPGLESRDQPVAEVEESSQAVKPLEKTKTAKVAHSRSSSDDNDTSDSSSDSDESSSDNSEDSEEAPVSGKTAPPTNGTTSATSTNGDFGVHMDLDRAEALRNATEPEISPENEPATDFTRTPQVKHTASYIISGTSETPASEQPTTEKSSSALEAIARRQLAIESAPKRARLNLNGAKRVIYGNLGQRTPKNKADEERVRIRLAEVGKPKKVDEAKKTEKEVEPESEAWRSKIKVMACECVDGENIVLSEPPYPFVQRWDPQQQYQAKKKARNKNKKRKSYDANHEYEYEGDYYEGDGYDGSILLNYDEENASAIQANTTSTEQGGLTDDLPPLPSDITTLPTADLEDLKSGTVITFKHLSMGKNFMPEMSDYKTAVVEQTSDLGTVEKGFLLLKLARRDWKRKKEKKFDNQGNRIYEKFEMPMGDEGEQSDEEAEDGILETNFRDLVDARILRMVRAYESEGEGVDDAAAAARQLLVEAGVAEKAAELVGGG